MNHRVMVTTAIIGLDAAGKTTVLYTLKLGEVVTTIPTIGKLLPPGSFSCSYYCLHHRLQC